MTQQPTVQDLVFQYGRAVAMRERYAHGDRRNFDMWNETCLSLWNDLKNQHAYADASGSYLKPKYKKAYYNGLDSVGS